MDTAIKEFVLYLEAERGYSTLTGKSYRSDLRLFCDHISQSGWRGSIEEIATALVRSWIVDMKGRGLANNTIARRIHALRSFWRYLRDTELVDHDPLRKISIPKRVRPIPTYLRVEELRSLLEAAQQHRDTWIAFRNYAMMAVCIYTGVRRGELINLRLGDVDMEGRLLRVCGKGGRWRVIPLADEACQVVSDWLEMRPKGCKHDYLFTTVRGNRIYPSRMQRIWRSILVRSGIRREGISLHTLRHSAATLLLQSGTCDIAQIQQLLGHSRLATTAIYLHVEPDGLRAAIAAHPLGKDAK